MDKDHSKLSNQSNFHDNMLDSETWEKEVYIKHIRQDLKSYCTPNELAKAIGGVFTPELIIEICDDNSSSIRRKKRKDKLYIERDSFLQHFKENLVIEDNDSNLDEDDFY